MAHAHILLTRPAYSTIDQRADFLLFYSAHVSQALHASHDKLAYLLANLASSAGVYSSAAQSAVLQAEADTFCSGDIVTFCWWSLLPFRFILIFLSDSASY
jgi:chlorite dismutase